MKETFILLSLLICLAAGKPLAGPPPPFDLETEHLINPIGIDVQSPRLTWRVSHPERGQVQTSFRVVISTTINPSTILDTGKVSSSRGSLVVPANLLESDLTYQWTVMWWDSSDSASSVSETAYFDTGFRQASDWSASWIGGQGNILRRDFTLPAVPNRARAYIAGIGYNELYVNGVKVSAPLTPGWTNYGITVLYNVYDVTPYLLEGVNCIGVMLGHGWYASTEAREPDGPLSLLFQLQSDGKTVVMSDTLWNITAGPITYDGIYNGESYDSRLEKPGWNLATYHVDATWRPVQGVPNPGGKLTFEAIPPVAYDTERPAESIIRPRNSTGKYVFDFGQNLSGWAKLKIKGPAGTVVTLRHAEVLNHDGSGNIYTDNLRSAKATDIYTLNGNETGEEYSPRFTYHGFRYIEFSAEPEIVPTLDTLTSLHYHSDIPQTGFINFTSASNILNQIQSNILWGQRSNFMSVPTDCDQRDERKGWMGDAQLSGEEALHNFYLPSFYKNFLNRMIDEQAEEGSVGDTVPLTFGNNPSDPAWGSALPSLALWSSQYYSNFDDLQTIYPALKLYVEFMDKQVASSGIGNTYSTYGDWVPPPQFPQANGHLVSAASYLTNIQQLIQMAISLGDNETATNYQASFAKLADGFNTAFWSDAASGYDTGLQTANVLPLFLGIVPEDKNTTLLLSLLNDLVNNHDTHLSTGIIGTKYLMLALHKIGRDDLALQIAENTDYPSWGYMITNPIEPATTLWELWDTPEEGPGMNSRNHIMFGAVGDWFYKALAGVDQADGDLDFSNIVISPAVVGNLRGVNSSFLTARGEIAVEWALIGGTQLCGTSAEGQEVILSCSAIGSSGVISDIKFGSYGTPAGACGSFRVNSSCHDENSVDIIRKFCVGKSDCVIPAHSDLFTSKCDKFKKLYVEAVCDQAVELSVNLKASIPVGVSASVSLPVLSLENIVVTESNTTIYSSGKFVAGVAGIANAELVGNKIVVTAGSGSYDFTIEGTEATVICADTTENDSINITCPLSSQIISQVQFASFGTPTGQCGSYSVGECGAGSTVAVVESLCLFHNDCQFLVSDSVFGEPCVHVGKLFAAQVVCATL